MEEDIGSLAYKKTTEPQWRNGPVGAAFRVYSRSPGAPNWQGFLRPARQKTAGILAVLQGFLTPQGVKRPAKAACREILNRLLHYTVRQFAKSIKTPQLSYSQRCFFMKRLFFLFPLVKYFLPWYDLFGILCSPRLFPWGAANLSRRQRAARLPF